MPEQTVPEEVYRDAALAAIHARTEHDADWGVDELVAFGEFRAAAEAAYRAGWSNAIDERGDG